MNGYKYELFIKLLTILIDWKSNMKILPEDFDIELNRFNTYLLHNTKITPPKNLRDIIICLKNQSLESLDFYLNEDLKNHCIINEDGELDREIKKWYELTLAKDDVDQDLVRKFLIKCRNEYQKTKESKIIEMYCEVRAFINPENHYVSMDKIRSLIARYQNVSNSIKDIIDWYEAIDFESKKIEVCPVCGKIVSNALLDEKRCSKMCMYYRDKSSLGVKEVPLKERLIYKKVKKGIYTFTLIPGISELRMYEKLTSIYGKERVKLYPDIDKFDISVQSLGGNVFIDVKDFASPYDLLETLVENKSFTKIKATDINDDVILVIPEHRKFLYNAGDYKDIIERKISKISNKLLVLYEDELYRKVGEICNEDESEI